MRTYLLNLYYPNLKDYASIISSMKDDVVNISGNNWRVMKAGEQLCTLAFATDKDPKDFQKIFNYSGNDKFHFLLVEISQVHAGWTDKSVYEWLLGRLAKG